MREAEVNHVLDLFGVAVNLLPDLVTRFISSDDLPDTRIADYFKHAYLYEWEMYRELMRGYYNDRVDAWNSLAVDGSIGVYVGP